MGHSAALLLKFLHLLSCIMDKNSRVYSGRILLDYVSDFLRVISPVFVMFRGAERPAERDKETWAD